MTHRRTVIASCIAAAFTVTYVLTSGTSARAAVASVPAFADVPFVFDGWEGVEAPELSPEVAEVLAADEYLHRYYISDNGGVEMDVAYYTERRVGASMHSPLNCLPGSGWTILEDRPLMLQTASGPREVRELVVRRNESVFAMTFWYQSGTRVLSGEVSMRVQLLADALRGRPADVGLVRVMTPLGHEAGTTREGVAAFSAALVEELGRVWR